MWRLLLLFSLLAIAGLLIARWWLGTRVLATDGKVTCRPNPDRWPEEAAGVPMSPGEAPAREHGAYLHRLTLSQWRKRDPMAAKRRETARLFGEAVPVLGAVVAVFAVIVTKLPVLGALALVLALTVLASLPNLLAVGAELRAIAHTSAAIRERRTYPRPDDEEAAIRCAIAHTWERIVPLALRWL